MAIIKKQADGSFFVEKRNRNKISSLLFSTLGETNIKIKTVPKELEGKDYMLKLIVVEKGVEE